MSLLQTIKAQQIEARKQKDHVRASLLTTLYSEAATAGINDGKRDSTDAEVIATVKKFIKNVDETLARVHESVNTEQFLDEKAILETFLPKQLNENELRTVITQFIETLDNADKRAMGQVMGHLKSNYNGQYDGKQASTITKELLG